MIRLDYYIRRKPGMSVQDFRNHWKSTHSNLWRRHADILGVRRHVHLEDHPEHPMAEPARATYKVTGEPFDGVMTSIWADIRVLDAALETDAGRAAYHEILQDEENFIAQENSYLNFGIEHAVVFDRERFYATEDNSIIRGVYKPDHLPGYDMAEIQRHWIAVHGGMSHEFTVGSGNRRYTQIHAGNFILGDKLRTDRGIAFNPLYFGHAEAFTSPEDAAEAAIHKRPAELFEMFIIDIDNFADPSSGYFALGKEYLVVDRQVYTHPLPKPIPRGERLPYKEW